MTPKEKIFQVARELGLSMTAEFVPWSQSRNKSEKSPSLNWRVTLFDGHGKVEGGRAILTTDYSAGAGHAPSYKQMDRSLAHAEIVKLECENGRAYMYSQGSYHQRPGSKPLQPDFADVLYSLAMDSDVIDSPSFEGWASNFGYDVDSRKAESIYRACLDIALKLRNAIGEDGLRKLREVCQDY